MFNRRAQPGPAQPGIGGAAGASGASGASGGGASGGSAAPASNSNPGAEDFPGARPPQRGLWLAMGTMLAVLMLAGYLYYDRTMTPAPVPAPMPGPMAFDDTPLTPGATHFSELFGPATAMQLMLASPGDQPMESNPADLPAYPSATRLSGVRRSTQGLVEERVAWSASGTTLADIDVFYSRAIAEAGFTPLPLPVESLGPSANRISRTFLRQSGAAATPPADPADLQAPAVSWAEHPQVLTLWIAERPAGHTKFLLWLKYSPPPPPLPESESPHAP